ncbi:homeobox-leucine zipper protein HAT22-like [Dioscorea cayenensis subsp. rotundata]|uniref:Homeobox-leucine zipper protein HAT22-like n=1 Tax=Dioscorea cayennensis subsp. rotundata TaxID=55577 RepID=A0AB40AZD0_DIOCR|nr:homeobox-leucine zipper protein HAT22-like [Dioscorea cayenensis subsp. rotundata]
MDKGYGVCDTGLALGLGYKRKSTSLNQSFISGMSSLEPMLTLGLSGDPYGSPTMSKVFKESTQSPVSSFSNANPRSIKSEEIIGEETGTEKVSPRGSDDDEEVCAKKKLRLTKDQSALLEERFKEHTTLNPKQKQALAKQLNLRPRQVEVWFQNRRARTKLKQTELDCELLKRRCETLNDENQRLQREVQELKALKLKSPLFMQFLKTSPMICPACERITGGDSPKGGPLMVAPPKHLFFNPFTTHSAAC